MRPVLPGDVSAAARVLLPVPAEARYATARRLIDEACAADLYRRRHGRAHGRWGNGTLMASAHGHPKGREISFDDPDFLDCQLRVIEALIDHSEPEAQPIQRTAAGSNSRRFMAIASPHSSQ